MGNLFINKTAVLDKMDIPGFEGLYYVKNDGTVWKCQGSGKEDKRIKSSCNGRMMKVHLSDRSGNHHRVRISSIMKMTYFKGKVPDGYVLMHINGMKNDWSVWNLKPISKKGLGKITYRHDTARSVMKRDTKTWKVVEIFKSASDAAKKSGCSVATICRACNKECVTRPGIAPDGYYYQWED